MKSIKVCEYSRSMSFHYDLILQDQASGERSQDQWSSGILILLKLYRCCDHALKICMWFGYNPQINFCYFFRHFLGIFTMKVNGQWVPCVCNSSYSFMPIYLKLCMCYGHGLKICMWFGYNSWIIFCHFFHNLNLVFFGAF